MKKTKIKKYVELTALKGLMRENKVSYQKMAYELTMATNTFSDKINGFSLFDAKEISAMADYLDIAPERIAVYFFPRMLRNSTKSRGRQVS